MLSARSSAELCRAVFADVIGGLAAIEEADEIVGAGDGQAADEPATRTRRRRRPGAPEVTPAPVEIDVDAFARRAASGPALPGEPDVVDQAVDEPEPMTGAQRRRMMATFRERGIVDRAERLRLSSDVVGRPLASAAELTTAEADRVLDYLDGLRPAVEDDPPAEDVASPSDEPPPAASTDEAAP